MQSTHACLHPIPSPQAGLLAVVLIHTYSALINLLSCCARSRSAWTKDPITFPLVVKSFVISAKMTLHFTVYIDILVMEDLRMRPRVDCSWVRAGPAA